MLKFFVSEVNKVKSGSKQRAKGHSPNMVIHEN